VAPTAVVEVEEESSVEVLKASASVEKVGDQAVRIGDKPVHEIMEERTGAEPVLADEEMETGAAPVLMDVEAVRKGEEPVPVDVEMGTGDMPVREKEGVILPLRILRVMTLKKWGSTLLNKPHNHPLLLLLKTLLKKPLPILNRRGRESRLRLGGRIFHGSGSS